jgi:cob(I)alamin adenosyltransferase
MLHLVAHRSILVKEVTDLERKGLVHIYTGDGKGKTTAAVGLGTRACGRGLKVLFVQFLKSEDTGEIMSFEKLGPNISWFRTKKVKGFFNRMNEEQKRLLQETEQEALDYAVKAAVSGELDMLILDEVLGSLSNKLISLSEVENLIKNKPANLELVLTGRGAPEALIELADYVSEIRAVKHPFEKGIGSREGIEY